MHPFHRHILHNNSVHHADYAPLALAGLALGKMHHTVAAALEGHPALRKTESGFALTSEAETVEARSAALKAILYALIKAGIIPKERHELYAVGPSFSTPPVALADRALMPILGFISHGVHCNAYVKEKGEIRLWIAKRSMTAHTDPGKLDHLVAGGQPYGLSVRDNLAKEAHEEAGVPRALVEKARSSSLVTYTRGLPHGVRRDTLFVYDLRLPDDFTPRSNDGESSDFRLMTINDVKKKLLEGDAFKFNVNLVLIDFLIRKGFVESDETGYAPLAQGLRPSLEW